MLSIIPISDAGIPIVKWTQYTEQHPTEKEIESWRHYPNRALICGKISNVIAIDIDTDDAGLIATIERQSGISPVRKRGTKGYTAFFQYSGELSHVWQKNGKVVCELLSDKRLTTIPPSVHRVTGKPYVWLDGVLGEAILPKLPDSFVAAMDAIFPKPQRTERVFQYDRALQDVDLSEAEQMLRCIDAGCSREQWVQIGMALRSEYGDTAYCLWHDWSARGGSKYNRRDADSAWRSFNGDGVTIGTLVYYAKEGGYMKSLPVQVASVQVVQKPIAEVVVQKPISSSIVAHGLVGEIADWMTRTAWKPQPLLSLSAALVFVGFLKGRKFITETDAYTNVYAFNIAGTACGKDRPQAAIKHLMARLVAQDKMLHAPASGTGFIDSLASVNGHGITCIDEMADYISSASGKNAAAYQRKVFKYWLEAFTSSSTFLDGERRADGAKEKAKRVDNPLFCLLGSTNANSLRLSLSGEEISNGLLNRFLFFHSELSPRKRKAWDFDRNEQLPDATIDKMREYLVGGIDLYGTQAGLSRVPFTAEAKELYNSIDEYYEDKTEELDANDPLRSLYGRAHEYVAKLALILCDDATITKKDVEVAQQIVALSVKTALSFCGDIADTKEEADYIKVKNIIKKAGEIKQSVLTIKTQFLPSAKRRQEILSDLLDAGFISAEKLETKGRGATMLKWQA